MKEWGSGNSFSHSPPKPPVRLTGLRVSQMGAGYLPSIGRWTATLSLLPSRLPSHILSGLVPETVPPLSHSFWIWVLSRLWCHPPQDPPHWPLRFPTTLAEHFAKTPSGPWVGSEEVDWPELNSIGASNEQSHEPELPLSASIFVAAERVLDHV